MDEKVNLRLHNAMIEVAVCEFWEKKIAETDWSNDGEHKFSDRHTARIKTVIKKHKLQARRRKVMRVVKRVAVVFLILFSVSFVLVTSSQAVREQVRRLRSQILELFKKEHPDTPIDGDEFMDYQTDMQIEQVEKAISYALKEEGLPKDASFQIRIDGYLNVYLHGINLTYMGDTAKLKPYIEPMVSLLSTAYASKNKNQLYYVQSIITAYHEITSAPEGTWEEGAWDDVLREYRQTIRDYMLENGYSAEEEIMSQTRIIDYVDGKLIFEVK